MTHNIACCYLTHNHPKVVQEVLDEVLDYYNENGIDIYIYDSSTSNETKTYVYGLMESGKKNLYYIPIDAEIGADGKILKILKGYGLNKRYDYIWPNKDRSYVTPKTANKIQQESHSCYDCIFLDYWIPMTSERRIYKEVYDKLDFFREFGWMVTSWESAIISTKLLQDVINWSEFEEKFELGAHNPFNQVMVVFGGLSLKDTTNIRVLNYKEAEIKNNPSAGSSWRSSTFELWGKKWPKAINMLPECYDLYKHKEIKEQGMHPYVFGSVDNLIDLERKNYLTPSIWDGIKDEWPNLSDIPQKYVEEILEQNYELIAQMAFDDFNEALYHGLYDKAYYILTRTQYMSLLLGNTYYWMIKNCFDAYLLELRNCNNKGIMNGVKDYQDLLYKYQKLKFYMRRLEYDVDLQETEIENFIINNNITIDFIMVVLQRECSNWEKVIKKLEEEIYEK